MARLTEAQIKHVVDILESGHCSLSRDTSDDYAEAAAFVFDRGIFFQGRDACLEIAREFRKILAEATTPEGEPR